MTNLDSALKSRNITLPTEVCIVKAIGFPVVTYGWESWTIKKAGWRRIDAFELWCWRILLRVPWTGRRSNQCILKEINPEYSLEGLMLKLNLQYLATWCEELMLGKIEGRRRRGQWRTRWMDGIIEEVDMSVGQLQEIVMDRGYWRVAVHGVTKSWTQLSDWTNQIKTTIIGFPGGTVWKLVSRVWLSDPIEYLDHGILQARILEWVTFPSPGDLPFPGIEPRLRTLQADSLPADP